MGTWFNPDDPSDMQSGCEPFDDDTRGRDLCRHGFVCCCDCHCANCGKPDAFEIGYCPECRVRLTQQGVLP